VSQVWMAGADRGMGPSADLPPSRVGALRVVAPGLRGLWEGDRAVVQPTAVM
jgi:hypothetical protein